MGMDGGVDTPTPQPCVPGVFNVCEMAAPTESLSVNSSTTINTDTDGRCIATAQAGGPDVCLMYFNEVEIGSSGRLIVSGSRALAIVSRGPMTVVGAIDASSRREAGQRGAGSAPSGLCSFAGSPLNASTGAGGGAGGSFASKAGNGGGGSVGATGGSSSNAQAAWSVLRGGCDGQGGGNGNNAPGGAGGMGGGALYLSAATLQISGLVLAGGSGGGGGSFDDGGGGGGSGGNIVLQSNALTLSGRLTATGGGGGGGGVNAEEGVGGQDGTRTEAAAGGRGGDQGDGGAGATNVTGSNGSDGTVDSGGGGGGGGTGFIVIIGQSPSTQGASIMPPALLRAQ